MQGSFRNAAGQRVMGRCGSLPRDAEHADLAFGRPVSSALLGLRQYCSD